MISCCVLKDTALSLYGSQSVTEPNKYTQTASTDRKYTNRKQMHRKYTNRKQMHRKYTDRKYTYRKYTEGQAPLVVFRICHSIREGKELPRL